MPPNLLVTYPVDLGNQTYEKNLQSILAGDLHFFSFPRNRFQDPQQSINYRRHALDKLADTAALRRAVKKSVSAGGTVLFQGISPALFSFGHWHTESAAILLDWTRCLYPATAGKPIPNDFSRHLHRHILSRCRRFLCLTDAVADSLVKYYGVPSRHIYRAPAPFDLEKILVPPSKTPSKPRVLFVGGDLARKGGDLLIAAWRTRPFADFPLTLVTNGVVEEVPGVTVRQGIKYGTNEHRKIFSEHDILVLPTKMDSYPQVIGEAAAAGMCVITTKYALGAPEVIVSGLTGFIEENPVECVHRLKDVLESRLPLDAFKQKAAEGMREKFSRSVIRERYLQILRA